MFAKKAPPWNFKGLCPLRGPAVPVSLWSRNIKITDRQLANGYILEIEGQHGEYGQHVFKTSQLLRDWMLVVLTIKKEIIIMHQETTNQHVIHLRLSPMLYVHYIPTYN